MQEVFEKIIEKLEEEKNKDRSGVYSAIQCDAIKFTYGSAIEIVKQEAEEYNNDQINQLAMMYAKNLVEYGIDITKIWDTATQQAAALNQAYMRGRQEERDRFEQYNNGWIPCSSGEMPEEHDSIFAKYKGTDKWNNAMFEKISDIVNVTVVDKNGNGTTTHAHKVDGKWVCDLLRCDKSYQVIAWQPLPKPYIPNPELLEVGE